MWDVTIDRILRDFNSTRDFDAADFRNLLKN